MGEETDNTKIVYLYDDTNSPIGMLYTTDSGEDAVWSAFWFEKNMQGEQVKSIDNRFYEAKSPKQRAKGASVSSNA